MSLIFTEQVDGPAAHALVIGVGYYHHLPGGSGRLYPHHEGLGQLSSPPTSARDFADWLLKEYHNPAKKLASLELLISEPEGSAYRLPDGSEENVERARFDPVRDALLRWNQRGDENPENLLIFFFCGHGVSRGYATSLLMEDFGENPFNPLERALSFREFYEGMDICQSRRQCYFIDACRKASPALITRYNNYTGQPVIPGSAYLAGSAPRTAPIFYATIPGEVAYGRVNQSSVFTDALLKALKGAGSNDLDEEGVWRVDTNTLNQGLDYLLRRTLGDSLGMGQVISVDELVNFTLHYLESDPLVPVTIGCKPKEANLTASLGYYQEPAPNPILRPGLEEQDWQLELQLGEYRFFAEFPNQEYKEDKVDRMVSPPFRKVTLKVSE